MRQGLIHPVLLFQEQCKQLVLEDCQYDQDSKECSSQYTDPFQVVLDDGVIGVELVGFRRLAGKLSGSLSFGFFTHRNSYGVWILANTTMRLLSTIYG